MFRILGPSDSHSHTVATGSAATAHYLTRSHDAVDIAKEIWRLLPESAQPRIEQPEPGVVEVTSAVDTDKSAMMLSFSVVSETGTCGVSMKGVET